MNKLPTLEEARDAVRDDVVREHIKQLANEIPPKQLNLLWYLVGNTVIGTLGLENASVIIKNFYQLSDTGDKAQMERWNDGLEFSQHPGKKLVQDLRNRLLKYYRDHPTTSIRITLGEKREHFRVHISDSSNVSSENRALESTINGNDLTNLTYRLGDNVAGLEYEIEQMENGSVYMIRDTHVRLSEEHREYEDDKLRNFENGLKTFLQSSANSRLEMVVGQCIEPKYLLSISNAVEGQEYKARFYKLRNTTPLLNFTILDFKDSNRDSVVLFGWGRFTSRSKEGVFLSSDPNLVHQFEEYYEALRGVSEKIPNLADVYTSSKSSDVNAQIKPWSRDRIYDLLRSAQPGSEVRILTTFFIDRSKILHVISEIIQKGVHVKIVLTDPESPLIKARCERRIDYSPSAAQVELREQIKALEEVGARQKLKGSLDVRLSKVMPYGFFVQTGNEMVIGLMILLSSYEEGPMIEVEANTLLGRELEKNWWGYWSMRSKAEMVEIEEITFAPEIWFFTPDFFNDTGKWAEFKDIVSKNAAKGTIYTVIYPKSKITEAQLQEFRGLFPLKKKLRVGLTEIPLNNSEMSKPIADQELLNMVIFNPKSEKNEPMDAYVEQPVGLWKKVENEEAKIIFDWFTEAIKRHSDPTKK